MYSLRDTDVRHEDPHTLCPVPPVHPKKSCSDVLVFALIHACLVVQSRLTLCDPEGACQAPLSMEFFSGKNTGVGCHFLLQEIFPTQCLNPHLVSPALQVDSSGNTALTTILQHCYPEHSRNLSPQGQFLLPRVCRGHPPSHAPGDW